MDSGIEVRALMLPAFLRLKDTKHIPRPVLQRGYDPNIGPQVAIFGTRASLGRWRKEIHLEVSEFPIQGGRMGPHVDIYGPDVKRVVSGSGVRVIDLEDFMEFYNEQHLSQRSRSIF